MLEMSANNDMNAELRPNAGLSKNEKLYAGLEKTVRQVWIGNV